MLSLRKYTENAVVYRHMAILNVGELEGLTTSTSHKLRCVLEWSHFHNDRALVAHDVW